MRHCPSVPARFTPKRLLMCIGPRCPMPPYPTLLAFYLVSVRQVRVLPPASFRPHLTMTPLPLASGSAHPARRGLSPHKFRTMHGVHKNGACFAHAPFFGAVSFLAKL